MKIKWTEKMVDLLIEYSKDDLKSRISLSKLLGISEGAIRNKESKIGLAWVGQIRTGIYNPMFGKERPDFKNNHWTKVGYSQTGEKNPNWKGGRYVSNGYEFVLVSEKEYKLKHRVVMENFLKRELHEKEVVHHINRDTLDNRIENLDLCKNQSKHLSIHWENGNLRRNI